jgi:alpha-L-fucosidase 2
MNQRWVTIFGSVERSRHALYSTRSAVFFVLTMLAYIHVEAQSSRLWYRQPDEKWDEALPLGNGRMGAMPFGGISDEHLQVNEGTLWGGLPHNYVNPQAAALLPRLRELIFAGRADEAESLSSGFLGSPNRLMPYLAFCDLHLRFAGFEKPQDYQRELRLDQARAKVTFRVGTITFKREAFISYSDNVLVVRLTASRANALRFSFSLDSPQPGAMVEATDNRSLLLSGQVQLRVNPVSSDPLVNPDISWAASWDKPGLRYAARAELLTEGGVVRKIGKTLAVTHATAVTLLFAGSTSFVNYQRIDADPLLRTATTLHRAEKIPYAQLLRSHLSDYKRLYSRVSLRLGGREDDRPTDVRLREIGSKDDSSLFALYYEIAQSKADEYNEA